MERRTNTSRTGRPPKRRSNGKRIALGFFLGDLPFFLFEFRHQFYNLTTMFYIFTHSSQGGELTSHYFIFPLLIFLHNAYDYLFYLQFETPFEFEQEISLHGHHNENERICIYKLSY